MSHTPSVRINPMRAAVWVVLLVFVGYAAWASSKGYRQQSDDERGISEAYAFVIANGDISAELPCYCGCKDQDHASLDMCFVSRRDKQGRMVVRDVHAETCPICIDVALLAARLRREGADRAAIRQAVESQYGPHGPSQPVRQR